MWIELCLEPFVLPERSFCIPRHGVQLQPIWNICDSKRAAVTVTSEQKWKSENWKKNGKNQLRRAETIKRRYRQRVKRRKDVPFNFVPPTLILFIEMKLESNQIVMLFYFLSPSLEFARALLSVISDVSTFFEHNSKKSMPRMLLVFLLENPKNIYRIVRQDKRFEQAIEKMYQKKYMLDRETCR